MTPRAITGLGVVSALGIGRGAVFRSLAEEPPSAPSSTITAFDATAYPGAPVLEVPDFDPTRFLGDKGLRTLDRQTKLLLVAARLCLHDAKIKKDNVFAALSPERVGICSSNAYGSLESISELDRVAVLEDARYINPAKFPNTVANSTSGYVSIWEDLRALNVAVSDGNCGAIDAVACAEIHMGAGRADAILVGGAEALSEPLFLAFQRFGALSTGALLGEGAALLAMEEEGVAKKRGANVLARVLGTGTAYVAPERDVLLHASPEALVRAIAGALEDAGLRPGDVDLVVSGATSFPTFGEAELSAIRTAIGESASIASPKARFGETLGAGGAMGMVAAVAWMQGVPVRAIASGRTPERVRTALVTSLGFYGNASAAVLAA